MISFVLVSVILTASGAAATKEIPNCELCDYNDGIGFVKSARVCAGYFVCSANPAGGYFYEFMCCPIGQTFDPEHLTCNVDVPLPHWCTWKRYCCPNITTPSAVPCPYKANPLDDHSFIVPGGKVVDCPMSEVWDQKACSCVRGPSFVPNDYCCKILHFTFDGTYDSYSCYNFAKGEPQNNPSVDNNVLCLDGNKSQSVAVPFLDNWFAWNPVGKTFTICFWFCPKYYNQTSGVFSTNYKFGRTLVSVLEVCLRRGEVTLCLGNNYTIFLWKFPSIYKFTKLCITFDNGIYTVYYNGWFCGQFVRNPMPVNSHSAVSLGYVVGKPYFSGYFDDFCFWTKVLPYYKIKKCYLKGPSNNYKRPVNPP